MGFFRINTNVSALNAQANLANTNRSISSSLEKLSSGLRINRASDDASGLAIADSLRSQASGLGQAIKNANNGINIIQIADKAMDEQTKIVDMIKVKAVQSAEDGQTTDSRKALQADIVRLMEELDNIAGTTSFNGQQLLSGQFSNKEFQIGAYSNQKVRVSIGATSSDKIGITRFETGSIITASSTARMTFKSVNGINDIVLESVIISTSAGTGLGVLVETINKNSNKTGVRASFQVQSTGSSSIKNGEITNLTINGQKIKGTIKVDSNDKDGALVASINSMKDTTGVEASVDSRGNLNLTSIDGRGIRISGTNLSSVTGIGNTDKEQNYGRLSLTRLNGRDIVVSGGIVGGKIGFSSGGVSEMTVSMRDTKGSIDKDTADAMGFYANKNIENKNHNKMAGVTTLKGAQAMMNIAESAQKQLDSIRSDLGSTQNQLISTVDNISITQVNIAAAESQIRDLDFAAESANFTKLNILAQAGSYALSQANAVQKMILKLLQ